MNKRVSLAAASVGQYSREVLLANSQKLVGNTARAQALARLESLGYPTRRSESYRVGKVERFLQGDYALWGGEAVQANDERFRCALPQGDAEVVFFFNGIYSPGVQEGLYQDKSGALWGSLQQAELCYPALVHSCIRKEWGASSAWYFEHVARALYRDGFFLYLPDGCVMERPLQVLSLLQATQPTDSLLVNQHHVVHVGKGASVCLLLCDHSFEESGSLTNATLDISIEAGGRVELITLSNHEGSNNQMNHVVVTQAADSVLNHTHVSLDGAYVRTNVRVDLREPGSESRLWGVLLSDETDFTELVTHVQHSAPHSESHELVKGVVDEESELSFYGLIEVTPAGQQTNALQRNANLVRGERARVNTRPQLLIHADDVRCTHGSTVGRMDEEARFYMQQRGIAPEEVDKLLMYAFVSEVLQGITLDSVRERLERLVESRLNGERMNCCGIPYNGFSAR